MRPVTKEELVRRASMLAAPQQSLSMYEGLFWKDVSKGGLPYVCRRMADSFRGWR